VLIPERRFETLFGSHLGGVLGIQLQFMLDGEESCVLYATAAPHSEPSDGPFNDVYLPDWIIHTLEQRTFRAAEEFNVIVELAEALPAAATIIVRSIGLEEYDVRCELEEALYDNRYVHAGTSIHLKSGEIWIESVLDADGFELPVAELGAEVAVDIIRPSAPEVAAPAVPMPEVTTPLPSVQELRELRLKHFGKKD